MLFELSALFNVSSLYKISKLQLLSSNYIQQVGRWQLRCRRVKASTFRCKRINFNHQRKPIVNVCCLGERSEAYSHENTSKWFRFSRPWHPSAFHQCVFLGTHWSDSYGFCKDTAMKSGYIIFQVFGPQFFFSEILAKKINFRIFYKAKAIFLSRVFTVSLELLMFMH